MKQCIRTLGLVGLIFSLSLVISAGSAVAKEETIKLGIIYAMTGKGSALGTKQMDAAKLAVEEIKQDGENSRQDQEIAQEARKSILEIVKDEFTEKNAILKESVTLSDNKGIPNVISRATPEFEEREEI